MRMRVKKRCQADELLGDELLLLLLLLLSWSKRLDMRIDCSSSPPLSLSLSVLFFSNPSSQRKSYGKKKEEREKIFPPIRTFLLVYSLHLLFFSFLLPPMLY